MIPFLNIICIFAKESCLSRVATTDDSCCRTYKEKRHKVHETLKILILAGKAQPKIIREDKLNELTTT